MSYPRFRYHKTLAPVLLYSEAEEKALGKGWEDSPAKFEMEKIEPIQDACEKEIEPVKKKKGK